MTSATGTSASRRARRLRALARRALGAAGAALRILAAWARPRLGVAAQWVIGVPFLVMGGYLLLVGPAYVAVKVTELALSTDVTIDEIAAVSAFMGLTFAGLRWAFAHRRVLESRRREALLRIALVLTFAVASFSALTAVLYHHDAITVRAENLREELVVDKAAEFYVWQLADNVPLLHITDNLNWTKPFEVEDRLSGLLVIVFTGVVILPLIPAIRLAAAGRGDAHEEAVLKTLRRSAFNWVVHTRPTAYGRHTAVVEELGIAIVVDAVRDVWAEEVGLRRLDGAGRSLQLLGAKTGAYVLVADRVGDRARGRIERCFAQSEIPAKLVAWRGDEPARELTTLIDACFGELASYEDAVASALAGDRGWHVETRPPGSVVERDGARVLVDVVRDVRRGRETLPRFDSLAASTADDHDRWGYLLVTGLAGMRARWRLERRFAQAGLPARLAVWTGEPDELAAVVDELLAELTPDATASRAREPAAAS